MEQRNFEIRNLLIPATFLCLWITGFFSESGEQILALALIFSFGILHGSNDLSLIHRLQLRRFPVRSALILALYVSFVLLMALLFYAWPVFALWAFIGFSAYHFGEQHWAGKAGNGPGWLRGLFFISYGSLILFMLFLLHEGQVTEIMAQISGANIPWSFFTVICVASGILFLGLSLYFFPRRQWVQTMPLELFLLGIFWVVFKTASLIWAFAIYFILWHSIPSLYDQVHLLYGRASPLNGKRYLGSAAVYWVASLVALAIAYFFFRDPSYGFLPLFFSFLAAITFPHVLVMSGLYRR